MDLGKHKFNGRHLMSDKWSMPFDNQDRNLIIHALGYIFIGMLLFMSFQLYLFKSLICIFILSYYLIL